MKTIAFHIEKGGVGKTTLAGNIGYAISEMNIKTLLIDADPQGNLSSWFGTDAIKFNWDLSDILQEKVAVDQAMKEIRPNLWMIPTFAIDGSLKDWSETKLFQQPFIFSDFITQIKSFNFDICIWDLSPGISNLERSILAISDEVIPIAAAEYFSFDGLETFNYELSKIIKHRKSKIICNKLILNRVNKSFALHREYKTQLENLNYQLFVIGQSTAIADSVVYHKTLSEYDPKNKNIEEINKIVSLIVYDFTVGVNN